MMLPVGLQNMPMLLVKDNEPDKPLPLHVDPEVSHQDYAYPASTPT